MRSAPCAESAVFCLGDVDDLRKGERKANSGHEAANHNTGELMTKLCHHVKEDGISCHSPALSGESYCYFHLRYKWHRLRTWRGRRSAASWTPDLPPPTDLPAIQISLTRVLQALADGRLDVKRGGSLLQGLNRAARKLRGADLRGGSFQIDPLLGEWEED